MRRVPRWWAGKGPATKLQISRLRTLGSFVSHSWMFSPGRRLEIRLPVSTATHASC
ncbi:hypothetical protein XHV734_1874 [Xanthomonas hortorum pv. vitians]|nr:hypothetical protein XHV734_1874 [Xanthomonas hortorum pv. vitians]